MATSAWLSWLIMLDNAANSTGRMGAVRGKLGDVFVVPQRLLLEANMSVNDCRHFKRLSDGAKA